MNLLRVVELSIPKYLIYTEMNQREAVFWDKMQIFWNEKFHRPICYDFVYNEHSYISSNHLERYHFRVDINRC